MKQLLAPKRQKLLLFFMIFFFGIYIMLLCYKYYQQPGLFIDESAYANEINSIIRYGCDTHGYYHPVYFQGPYGGQSILGSWFIIPWLKIFGFSLATWRFPFLLINLLLILGLTILIVVLTKKLVAGLLMELSLITAPWIYLSARWVLDCNIAPLVFMFGLMGVAISLTILKSKLGLILSLLVIALTAYGYVAFWLYLPIFLIFLFAYLWRQNFLSLREILFVSLLIGLLVLPLVIFAYEVNIKKILTAQKFLWLTLPPLPGNRVGSLINFHKGNLLLTMINNCLLGWKQYLFGSDNSPWNSIQPYGIMFPPFFIIAAVGAWGKIKNHPLALWRSLLNLSILSFVPLMFIVKPNYNHWNALNWPLIVLLGIGAMLIWENLNKQKLKLLLVGIPLMVFALFINSYYGGIKQQNNYFNDGIKNDYSSVRLQDIKPLFIMAQKNSQHDFYISGLSNIFVFFKTINPVSPDQDAQLSDQGKGEAPRFRYGNLVDYQHLSKIKLYDYLVIPYSALRWHSKSQSYQTKITHAQQFKLKKCWNFLATKYTIVQRIK